MKSSKSWHDHAARFYKRVVNFVGYATASHHIFSRRDTSTMDGNVVNTCATAYAWILAIRMYAVHYQTFLVPILTTL